MAERTVVMVGIAGGSGAGKTAIAGALTRAVAPRTTAVVSADWYYRDLAHLDPAARAAVNFDDPAAIDVDALVAHLTALRRHEIVEAPIYRFDTHTRAAGSRTVHPAAVVVVDGLVLYHPAPLADLFDLRVFVDAPADVRLARRIVRDVVERGRTADSVIAQYLGSVRPMHERWVEPQRQVSHVVIPNHGTLDEAVALVMRRLDAVIPSEEDRVYVRS